MEISMRTLLYQTYTLACQLAQKARKAFYYERCIDPASADYISFGYWVDSQAGIHSGERLFYSLKTLAAAYHDKRGYDFEITKHISIRQLDPPARFRLRELGKCEIIIPEVLYDMDFPGHYQRMVKSVSLRIPCVVGPYTSILCTLRLLNSIYRTSSLATDKNAYPQDTIATTLY
jgi:Tc toxin complex TcA C-terminal TcB-binding domain